MKKFIPFLLTPLLLMAETPTAPKENNQVSAENPAKNSPQDIGLVSKAFGHIVGQNLVSLGLDFDMKEVVIGIQESLNGVTPPMSEAECIQAISLIQENAFQKLSLENLVKAEEFLAKNKKESGVIEISPGKLQYIILKEGSGKEVESTFSPIIRYVGKFIDGKIFGQSQEDEVISLEETIEGFKMGIVGMKEGEKRRIFVHPDCGYGTTGYLPPSSLLTFDIEVIAANAPKVDDAQISKSLNEKDHAAEIATIDLPQSNTR